MDPKVPVAPPAGWWDTMKETLSIEHLSKRFDLSFHNIVAVAAYVGIGALSGFFVKKYGKYVLLIMFITGLSIAGLVYLDIVTVNWMKAKATLGISEEKTLGMYFAWAREHLLEVISVSVGFLLGLFIG